MATRPKISHHKRLEKSKLFLDLFNQYKAEFIAHFPLLAGPFADDWQTIINSALVNKPLWAVRAETAVLSADRKQAHTLTIKALKTFYHYARQAFEDDSAMLKSTGKAEMKAVYISVRKTLLQLTIAGGIGNIAEYKSALLAAGYTQPQLNELEILRLDLDAKNILLKSFKQYHYIINDDRTIIYRQLYANMVRLNKCAKVVFAEDGVKRGLWGLG